MTTPESFSPVLTRLLESLVDPKAVRSVVVEYAKLKGRVNWHFNADVNEVGKIVGKKGVKLRALRLLVQIAGNQNMEQWWLDQPTDSPGVRLPFVRNVPEIPDFHDTTKDFELLRDLLLELGVNASLSVSGSVREGFKFVLRPAQIQDNMALLDQHDAIYHGSQMETAPINLISSLGLLWWSVGAMYGVRYKCDVEH